MIILELAKEVGLNPVRISSTNGGEYQSPCPECGGNDRFRIWPNQEPKGSYWCRKCEKAGDAIQFCIDFMRMQFLDASKKVGLNINISASKGNKETGVKRFIPKLLVEPSFLWRASAIEFIEQAHHSLLKKPHLLNMDKDRGLSLESIKKFQLGWNDNLTFVSKESWGITTKEGEKQDQKLCLPKGIVIPCFRDKALIRVKIRRDNWVKEDKYPKYHIISGGVGSPIIYGDLSKPIILLEAEFDAMLVQQVAEDLCCCIALGSVSNKPDQTLHLFLQKAPLILYALDFDDSGKKQYAFWRSTYSQLKAWPVSKGKSPGDAFNFGVDLRRWVLDGLEYYKN